MKTEDVRALIRDVLDTLSEPYSHHVIDEVFAAIEKDPTWRNRYELLCSTLGRDVVNTWGGRWIALTLERSGEKQVPSKKSTLIGSYSILDVDSKVVTGKPSREEALQLMSEYYRTYKGVLPSDIREHRDLIVELIMAGVPAEQAFTEAIEGRV